MDNPAMTSSARYIPPALDDRSPAFLQLLRTGYFQRLHGHHMRREAAGDYLLIWVLEGHGQAESEGQHITAGPGDVLMFDKGPMHEYSASTDDPWTIVWVHFDGDWARDFFQRIRHSAALQGRLIGSLGLDPALQQTFREVITQAKSNPQSTPHLCGCLLAALLGRIIHQLNQPRSSTRPRAIPDLTELLAWIDQHLSEPLTTDDLARVGRISPRQLTRRFRQITGMSPLGYVIHQRMTRAAVLLSQTALPIKQIGQAVGCDDPYYFSRLFKQVMKVSPQSYRAAQRIA